MAHLTGRLKFPDYHSPNAVLVLFLALTLFTFGCQAFSEPTEEHEEDQELPEVITIKSPASGDHYAETDIEHEFDMCNIVSRGESLILVEIVEFAFDNSGCEESPYRLRHADGTVGVIDAIAGADFGQNLEIVWFGGSTNADGWSQGQHLLLSLREVGGVFFVARELAVELSDGFSALPVDHEHTTVVYDVPEHYEDFVDTALEYWDNFESHCGGPRNVQQVEDLEEYYFGEPDCSAGGGGGEHNDDEPDPDEVNDGDF
jgi:hypothetical protein